MSEEIMQAECEEQVVGRSEAKGKVYRIKVSSIVANTNPRNPLSQSLKNLGYTAFGGDMPVWELATSEDPGQRAKFCELMQAHDEEFCNWATTFMTQGQLQPIEVRDNGGKAGKESTYTLVFGCRRCLAILYNWCMTGKPSEPIVEARLAKGSNVNLLHRAFVENERRNPSILEEAESIQMAINAGCEEEEVAKARGYSISTIRNRLALLNLEPAVQKKVRDGKITATKALNLYKEASSNGHTNGSVPISSLLGEEPAESTTSEQLAAATATEPKIRVRSKKEILAVLDEYSPGTETHKALSWVLGLREEVGK